MLLVEYKVVLSAQEMPDLSSSLHSTDMHCLSDSSVTGTPSASLTDLLKRDAAMRVRIKELMASLDTLSKSSEQRHQQSAMFVNELKRANRYISLTIRTKISH